MRVADAADGLDGLIKFNPAMNRPRVIRAPRKELVLGQVDGNLFANLRQRVTPLMKRRYSGHVTRYFITGP